METKVWQFMLDDKRHIVALEPGSFGSKTIMVDGNNIGIIPFKFFDTGSIHHFKVSNTECALEIKCINYLDYEHEYNLNIGEVNREPTLIPII
jgi:hypothetical protein